MSNIPILGGVAGFDCSIELFIWLVNRVRLVLILLWSDLSLILQDFWMFHFGIPVLVHVEVLYFMKAFAGLAVDSASLRTLPVAISSTVRPRTTVLASWSFYKTLVKTGPMYRSSKVTSDSIFLRIL
ncbi:hypothetical protein OUZ56_026294 [Daphnia magna]|uniref:Uncharacterized protein n=1 Tax=Daphnia magna TaxID=35525 RepID=A0ABQ9ZLD3_9CRUS|nr:hypothetical protein OUZ56_026294 [Daphnia magna]